MSIAIADSYADALLPVYRRHTGRDDAQPASIYMDDDGRVWASYRANDPTWMPGSEWHKRTITWDIPNNITGEALDELLETITPLLERVHAGHTVEWDGYKSRGELDDDAVAAFVEIEREISAIRGADTLDVWEAQGWDSEGTLADEVHGGMADADIATLAEYLRRSASGEGIYIYGLYEYLTTLRDRLRDAVDAE